eukprot:g1317.t1
MVLLLALCCCGAVASSAVASTSSFEGFDVTIEGMNSSQAPVLGRVLVYISRHNDTDPIAQCADDASTSQVFGVDTPAGGLRPGEKLRVGHGVLGYPRESLANLPMDEPLFVQAQLLRYDTYHRGDGHAVVLPVTCVNPGGNDGSYGAPAGTLFSRTVRVSSLRAAAVLPLALDRAVPVTPSPGCAGGGKENSKYIRTVRLQSTLLTKFWGRPVVLEACVLLPLGFDEPARAHARYPLVIAHGHYSAEFNPGGAFSETPPAPDLQGYEKIEAEYAYALYKNWTASAGEGGAFEGARMLVVSINHDNPFFDDVKLLPHIEQEYRGLGQGWARGLYGGSTGGWESIGVQTKYPDAYNGAYAACPDPVSFTSYATVNLYEDRNAYTYDSDWKATERPAERDHYSGQTVGFGHPYGHTTATMAEVNHRELVLGERSRSCGQWDIWEAVFGPKGPDGYPERVWDKRTGVINRTVVAYWREHFDLLHIMKRDWVAKGLGKKLQGKIHLFVGGSDTFFLTDAVMDMQDYLESTTQPYYNGSVTIGVHGGRGYEHCFNGYYTDPTTGEQLVLPNSITRLLYNQKFLPLMARHFVETAPAGADVKSWRY